ncbi:amidase [Acidimangrovimonas sediminis]|uniref:amidase n=1 Tax=Acidimangrovimonas sediminis TaxID=2056283 RepID=UPI000C804D7B|nr:amidase family protein [Acidimangrovimonas sediminis]
MEDWLRMSASDLGRGIGAGRIDPVALTQAFLDAIAAHPDSDRIYARVTAPRALAEAGAARARAVAGQRTGLLDGVPISWKDLFDSAGVATEAGSALLEGRTPKADARVLSVATLGGSVCLGKTHMSELAFSGLGLNPVTATPPCINDPAAVPGGSSSGAAASVAFGLAAAAIGSDTGGSVRIPAAWNDLVGLKTGHGRVSLDGVVPLCETFDTVGPLTRTVEDAAEVLALIEGGAPADLKGATLSGARLAILDTVALDDLRAEPAKGFETACDRLARAGATIDRIQAPEVAEAMGLAGALFTAEAYGIWSEVIEAAPDKMFARILERFRGGADTAAADYVAGWRRLRTLRAAWTARVAGYDAIILPSAPNLPPEAARLMTDDRYYVTENLLTLRNTRIGNLMGSAGLTLPTGVPSTGIQFLGLPMSEERLLRLGAAAERALPG